MADEKNAELHPPDAERRATGPSWDFLLILITVGILGVLGVQSLLGTIYSWWAYRNIPGWEQVGYAGFVQVMNAVAAPLVVALVVVMGLCVPKRLLARRTLLVASAGMVAIALVSWALTGSMAVALTVYLAEAALIQLAVVILTLAGIPGLGYLSHGRVVKAGSGLLHLGFILFAIVIVALQESPLMLPVFSAASILMMLGSVLAFYARPSARERAEDDF